MLTNQQLFLDPMGGGVVVDNKDNVINTYIPEDIKKTIGTGDAGGIIKKEGLSSLKEDKQKPVQGPSAPTKAQLREQNIRAKEKGLKSLYGQYAETGEERYGSS